MSENNSGKTTIIVALITVVGGLCTAALTNWDKIASSDKTAIVAHTDATTKKEVANAPENITEDAAKEPKTQRNPHFTGSVGKMTAKFELYFNTDGVISGSYYYTNRPNTQYVLKGKDLNNNKIELTEYTNNEVSATCRLTLYDNCFEGNMHNTDGRILPMKVCQ